MSLQTVRNEESTVITEAALMDDFVKSLSKISLSHVVADRILLPQLDGIQGRPDLVEIHFQALPDSINLDVLAMSLRSPAKARLLALLRYGAPRRRTYLEIFTGFTKQALASHLEELERDGLVEFHKNSAVSLSCPLPWKMANIVAYEGKLTNWRRALHQAFSYRSFSHCVWIVMPTSGAVHARKLMSVFRANGIGLIAVEDDGRTHIEIRGRQLRPTSRRLYLMAVGAGLTKFLGERRRLHRRIKPESIQSI